MTMNDKEATSTEVEAAEVLVEAQNAKSETPNTYCKYKLIHWQLLFVPELGQR